MALKRALLFVLPVCALVPIACSKESGGPAGTGSSSASVQASNAPTVAASPTASGSASGAPSGMASANKPARMMNHGPAGMMLNAASKLDLKEPQKTAIDKLEADLAADDGSMKTEMKDMHADVIAGIRAGKLDTAKLDAHRAAMDKSMTARREKEATALNSLHATLDPAQRKALVASMRSKEGDKKEGEHKKLDDNAKHGDMAKRRVERMTKDLALDADQQKKIEAMVPKMDPKAMEDMRGDWKKSRDAMLTAFEGDTFDAKKLDSFAKPKNANAMMDNEMKFLGQILPILKPEQREKLAAKMEEKNAKGGMMGPGGHMGGHMGPGQMGAHPPFMGGDPGDEPTPAP